MGLTITVRMLEIIRERGRGRETEGEGECETDIHTDGLTNRQTEKQYMYGVICDSLEFNYLNNCTISECRFKRHRARTRRLQERTKKTTKKQHWQRKRITANVYAVAPRIATDMAGNLSCVYDGVA